MRVLPRTRRRTRLIASAQTFALWLWALVCACGEGPDATSVLVVVDGDAALQSSLSRLEVQVIDGTELEDARQQLVIPFGPGERASSLPLSFTVAAKHQSDTRAFRIIVAGYDATSSLIVEQQVITNFHPAVIGRLDIYLYPGCQDLCRNAGQLSGLTCTAASVCSAVPVLTELPVAAGDDLGGYTVVQTNGAEAGAPGPGANPSTDAGIAAGSDAGTEQDAQQPSNETDAGHHDDTGAGNATDAGPSDAADVGVNGDADASPDAEADASYNPDADADADADAATDGATDVDASSIQYRADPVIPTPSMVCPSFASGTVTVMGLTVRIEAGTPGTTKGPLLFYWHGTGMSSGEYTSFLPAAIRNEITSGGGMIISPETSTETGTDTTGTGVWKTGDFGFADLIAGCAVRDFNIDPRRIYTTGCDAGALHSGAMAFERASYIAAASTNSGGLGDVYQPRLRGPRPAPVLTMHGGSSDQVILSFSDTSALLDSAVKSEGSVAVDCDHGGGHCAAPPELQVAAWQFMKDHPFGVAPEPYSVLPATFPSYCASK